MSSQFLLGELKVTRDQLGEVWGFFPSILGCLILEGGFLTWKCATGFYQCESSECTLRSSRITKLLISAVNPCFGTSIISSSRSLRRVHDRGGPSHSVEYNICQKSWVRYSYMHDHNNTLPQTVENNFPDSWILHYGVSSSSSFLYDSLSPCIK